MCEALCGHDRRQPSTLSYARLRAMDALAFEELLVESFERRGRRVIRNRRYNGDAGIDGQVMFERRVWLIQAKRYGGAIGPEHVRAFAALCTDRGVPGLLIHTGRTGRASHEVVARHGIIDIVPGAAAVGSGRRRSHRYRRDGAVMPKLPLIYAVLAAAIIIPGIAQARGNRVVAEEREIAGCIHRSARGKPWLEAAMSAVYDLEGGWIGAQVRNRNGSHDLGHMQINSWWVSRFANLLAQPLEKIQQWL